MNVRRVVTGLDAEGRAVITGDDETRVAVTYPNIPGLDITRLWTTDTTPPPVDGEDLTLQPWALQPPDGGLNWQIIRRPPNETEPAAQHRTDTLDLVLIMSGEVWLHVGEQAVLLRAGDCVVQRATDHSWRNPGSEPCVMLALMLSTVAERP
jgi:mannose-6-phosphate isomerase-like protein (cupin superfamily)